MEELEQILEGCRKYDRKSQEKLYRQFYPAFYGLCKTFFTDKHDILTALNNGMMKIFKHINQYDSSKGEFFNWAYTTVRHAALTQIRDKKTETVFESLDNYIEIQGENPFKELEWQDIYFYLDQLPVNTRAVCNLFYIEGFAIKEIAEAINMKEGTVKWHLNESRNRLKDIFKRIQSAEKSA